MNIYDPISMSLGIAPVDSKDLYNSIYEDSLPEDAHQSGITNNGRTLDSEWRANISQSLKGRVGPNRGKKLPDNHPFKKGTGSGRVWTEEQKGRVRTKLTGRKLSEETKRKLSESRKKLFIERSLTK